MKKRWVIFLLIISLLLNLFIIGFPVFFERFHQFPLAGKSIYGLVSLFIQGEGFDITIHSPLNITYNFTLQEYLDDTMYIDLEVSSSKEVDSWWYTLRGLRKNIIVEEDLIFTPNTTSLNVVRWENHLIVFANGSDGYIENLTINFFVRIPNSAPILGPIEEEMLICERQSLIYPFNATDLDEDPLSFGITPSNPFFVFPTDWTSGGSKLVEAYLVSTTLQKNHIGNHDLVVSVLEYAQDPYAQQNYSDSKNISIYIIEVNNPPLVSEIGTHTIWTHGDDSTFSYQVGVFDIEEGTHFSGDFHYELFFLDGGVEPFFNISNTGFMDFTPNESHIGNYNLRVCVTDNGIENIHPNISLCAPYGVDPETTCKDFSLTITNENRPPEIIDWNPQELELNAKGTDLLHFEITKYDPDGTIPSSYWFVDGELKQFVYGNSSVDEFNYSFGCDVSGIKQVKVEITDGLANASLIWEIDVELVPCFPPSPPSPPTPPILCQEKWVCEHWNVCQKMEPYVDSGFLTIEDFDRIKEKCSERGISNKDCGFQIRECIDLNNCNNPSPVISPPPQISTCLFSPDPSCFDGIRNCHSGSCEIGIDCGGPCAPCPTCSDGIQNQGEEGIDCGGPCPWPCPEEVPFFQTPLFRYILIIFLLMLLIVVVIKIKTIVKMWKEVKED